MKNDINLFLNSWLTTQGKFNEQDFIVEGKGYLLVQLSDYLTHEGRRTENTFLKLINRAQQCRNIDTNKRFWSALYVFDSLTIEDSNNNINHQSWLRFITIVESLQGYNGSQLFGKLSINQKRIYRLYFAYMLVWEHLRYIAGNDDEFSPSSIILENFAALDEHDHEH